jgi:hypothetical protein
MKKKSKFKLAKIYILLGILKLSRILLKCCKQFVRKIYNKIDWKTYRGNSNRYDKKAEKWAKYNKWFGDDETMTYAAFRIHRQLIEFEGVDPKSNRYYNEIDKRIYDQFKDKISKYYSMDN